MEWKASRPASQQQPNKQGQVRASEVHLHGEGQRGRAEAETVFEAVGRRIASGRQWTMTMCVRWKAGWRVWLADRKAGRERRAGACMAPKGEAGRAWLAFSGGALARPAGGRVSGRISMPSSRPRPRHHHRPCRLSAHAAAPEVASARTRSRCGTPASEPRKARQRASEPARQGPSTAAAVHVASSTNPDRFTAAQAPICCCCAARRRARKTNRSSKRPTHDVPLLLPLSLSLHLAANRSDLWLAIVRHAHRGLGFTTVSVGASLARARSASQTAAPAVFCRPNCPHMRSVSPSPIFSIPISAPRQQLAIQPAPSPLSSGAELNWAESIEVGPNCFV